MTTRGDRRRVAVALALLALALLLGGAPRAAHPAGAGTTPLRLAQAARSLTGGVVISTVPPVAGYPVAVDGATYTTDAEGHVTLDRAQAAGPSLIGRVQPGTATIDQDGRTASVRSTRVSESPGGVVLWLELSYLVHFTYTAPDGSAIDPSRLTSVRLRSSTGAVVDSVPGQDIWLTGSRVVSMGGQAELRNVRWSFEEVLSSGSNVVNASQQRFWPTEEPDVAVQALFFQLHVSTSDAFFHYATGSSLTLHFPDGHAETRSLDGRGRASFPLLPRGTYTITTHGPGPDISRPLTISRHEDIDLALYSWLDLGVLGGAALGAFSGLLVLGQARRRRHRLASAVRGSSPETAPAVPRIPRHRSTAHRGVSAPRLLRGAHTAAHRR